MFLPLIDFDAAQASCVWRAKHCDLILKPLCTISACLALPACPVHLPGDAVCVWKCSKIARYWLRCIGSARRAEIGIRIAGRPWMMAQPIQARGLSQIAL